MSLLLVRRALISVFDKSNILNLSQSLSKFNIQLLSTEGTARILSESGVTVQTISDYTQFPEIMNGRIKTLHHKICAGILARKHIDDAVIHKYDIKAIDMVIVNFYPFHLIIKKNKQYNHKEILEYIDIGGPNMIRAAAKNYKNTVTIIDTNDYPHILNEMKKYNGSISLETRFILASKAFTYITKYDSIISDYLNDQLYTQYKKSTSNTNKYIQKKLPNYTQFPEIIKCMDLNFIKTQNMRYGENPHQKSALYKIINNAQINVGTVSHAQQLQGKSLSYNNVIDVDTALECVKMFEEPTCVIVKHANPCGVATSDTINTAYNKAYQANPTSAFGGIIAFNRPLNDKKIALSIIQKHFVEVIIAPDIHQNCLDILNSKKNIRILKSGIWKNNLSIKKIDFKSISGGLLIQDYDDQIIDTKCLEIVTISKPNKQEIQDSLFCWKIVKFVKSNAIVCGKNYQTTGIGSGQTSRVFAVKIATSLMSNNHSNIKGSVMASDAFFTFNDGIHIAAKMGISCIIQPGGSIQDAKIIKTANDYGISMIFTHTRHFRH